MFRSDLEEMTTLGHVRPGVDLNRLALALLSALQGGLLLAQIERDTAPLEAGLDAVIELIALQSPEVEGSQTMLTVGTGRSEVLP